MLAAAGSIFGLFLLSSLYLQNVLGMGPLATGLAFIPLALAAGIGAHAAGHIVSHHGVRGPLTACVRGRGRRYGAPRPRRRERQLRRATSCPECSSPEFGLGVAVVSVSIAILTGTREEETGMISGLNSTGHEIGGTIGIAIFSTIAAGTGVLAGPQAASGISHAFVAAALLADRRQPGRARRPPNGTPLRAEAAAEPERDAGSLSRTAKRRAIPRPRWLRSLAIDAGLAHLLARTRA